MTLKKRLGHEYAKRRHLEKKSLLMDASHLLFLQLFDKKKRRHEWDGAEEQLTQGLRVC